MPSAPDQLRGVGEPVPGVGQCVHPRAALTQGVMQPLHAEEQQVGDDGDDDAQHGRGEDLGLEVGVHARVDEVAEPAEADDRADRDQRHGRDHGDPQTGHGGGQGERQFHGEQQPDRPVAHAARGLPGVLGHRAQAREDVPYEQGQRVEDEARDDERRRESVHRQEQREHRQRRNRVEDRRHAEDGPRRPAPAAGEDGQRYGDDAAPMSTASAVSWRCWTTASRRIWRRVLRYSPQIHSLRARQSSGGAVTCPLQPGVRREPRVLIACSGAARPAGADPAAIACHRTGRPCGLLRCRHGRRGSGAPGRLQGRHRPPRVTGSAVVCRSARRPPRWTYDRRPAPSRACVRVPRPQPERT